MTKEQAIEVLHELDGSLYETQQVALDLAIKALEQQSSDDCVSRDSVKELFQEGSVMGLYYFLGIDDLPRVTPTHGTCKDCKHCQKRYGDGLKTCLCKKHSCNNKKWSIRENFYCADFEKRGSENEND